VIVHCASPTFADPLKSNGGGTTPQVKQENDIFASNVARAYAAVHWYIGWCDAGLRVLPGS